jgi:ABC-type phosphate/phosphonate transport system substrate-binding protein
MSQAGSQAWAFYREVAEKRVVWTVRDAGGFPAPKNSSGERAQPFWSSRSRVEKIIATVPAYANFEPYEISWEYFCAKWVPGLTEDGLLVGVNWSGPRAKGYDLEPGKLQEYVQNVIDNPQLQNGANIVRTILINVLFLSPLATLLGLAANADQPGKTLQIGIAKSFLTDQPKAFAEIATDEFKDGMKSITGFDGDLATKLDAFEVAEKLDAKKLDLGVFHAHELAWVQKKYPDLEPILIAAGKHKAEQICIIVNQKSAAKTFADFRGKGLDLPLGSKEYARLFLAKLAAANKAKGIDDFFGSIVKSASRNEALDQVARGKADAMVIDQISLEFYRELKPAVFDNNLRILEKSEDFPPVAIVVKKGGLDPASVKQFRDGLLKADKNREGRNLMKSWSIKNFEPLPKDYDQKLAEIVKAYPPPMR